jgi:hypothetical protein
MAKNGKGADGGDEDAIKVKSRWIRGLKNTVKCWVKGEVNRRI